MDNLQQVFDVNGAQLVTDIKVLNTELTTTEKICASLSPPHLGNMRNCSTCLPPGTIWCLDGANRHWLKSCIWPSTVLETVCEG